MAHIRKTIDLGKYVYIKVWQNEFKQHLTMYINSMGKLRTVGVSPRHAGRIKKWLNDNYPGFKPFEIWQVFHPGSIDTEKELNKIEEKVNMRKYSGATLKKVI